MTSKNGDMPAMPLEAVMTRSNGNTTAWTNYTGLTKREMMAMHIAAGLISDPQVKTHQVAEDAVRVANLLLAELERTPNHFPDAAKMVPDGCAVLMTLDEAIDHANEKSIGSSQCAAQHAQLAKWLTDYRAMLAAAPKPEGGAS